MMTSRAGEVYVQNLHVDERREEAGGQRLERVLAQVQYQDLRLVEERRRVDGRDVVVLQVAVATTRAHRPTPIDEPLSQVKR